MSLRDTLRTESDTRTRFPYISVKIKGGKFLTWNREEKREDNIGFKITGALIGDSMIADSYSDDLGSKGGSYRTSPYFSKDQKTALWGGGRRRMVGNLDEIEDFIKTNSTSNLRKRRLLFIRTTGESPRIYGIETNLTIAIHQLNSIRSNIQPKVIQEYQVQLEAKIYAGELGPQVDKYLGKVAKTNPPNFASITTIKEWSDEELNSFESEFKAYRAWRKSITAKPEAEESRASETTSEADAQFEPNSSVTLPVKGDEEVKVEDLPF